MLEAAQLLLNLGADVNAVDDNGETAMHGAAYKNLPKVVQFLADNGAKIEVWNQKNKYGWTPLLIAEGHRPGNFKPSAETIAALHRVMLAAGVYRRNDARLRISDLASRASEAGTARLFSRTPAPRSSFPFCLCSMTRAPPEAIDSRHRIRPRRRTRAEARSPSARARKPVRR